MMVGVFSFCFSLKRSLVLLHAILVLFLSILFDLNVFLGGFSFERALDSLLERKHGKAYYHQEEIPDRIEIR